MPQLRPNEPTATATTPRRRGGLRLGRTLWVTGLLVCLLVAVQDLLARPSLTRFDPVRMGRLEAEMWRCYYEHRWFDLAKVGFDTACGEYGFSWWDASRSSLIAARAALAFRQDTHHPRCLPLLERYYKILSQGLGRPIAVSEAARLELQWWQERRQPLPPETYAQTIAANAAMLYGHPAESLLPASLKRAAAMDYRDRHGRPGEMTEAHWEEVRGMLAEAYAELKRAL